jgi:hypothetical protein
MLLAIISTVGKELDPESLALLQAVYDSCRRKLEGVYGGGDGSQLTDRLKLAAKRIMDLAEQGVTDPEQLEKQALAGLLPDYP